MHARSAALIVGLLAVMADAAVATAEPLGLTPQHVAILGVLGAGLSFLLMGLPSAGVKSRRLRKTDLPPKGTQ